MTRTLYLALYVFLTVLGENSLQAKSETDNAQDYYKPQRRKKKRPKEKKSIHPLWVILPLVGAGVVYFIFKPTTPTPSTGGGGTDDEESSPESDPVTEEESLSDEDGGKTYTIAEIKKLVLKYEKELNEPTAPSSSIKKIQIKHNGNLVDVDSIESKYSQYTLGATGSCTVNALEAGFQLRLGKQPSKELIDYVVALAALYQSRMHTGMEDIQPKISRYKDLVELFQFKQKRTYPGVTGAVEFDTNSKEGTVRNFEKDIKELLKKHGAPLTVLVTKPPESVFFHIENEDTIYFYDSHTRTERNIHKSHFLIFKTVNNIKGIDIFVTYMKLLFPYQDLGVGFEDEAAQQINRVEYTPFRLKKEAIGKIKKFDDQSLDTLAEEFQKLADSRAPK